MKRIAKSLLGILLLVVMVLGLSNNANALTHTRTFIIDNDDAQGYSNNRNGFETWFQASTLYNQDARRQACDSTNKYYNYVYPKVSSSQQMTVQISAYLYHTSFTDPAVVYTANISSDIFFEPGGTLNQDLAAAGWNVVGDALIRLPDDRVDSYYTSIVSIEPSGIVSGKYCGADAVKAVVTYQ